MNKIHVLIFPAGEVNSLELHDSLACCVNIKLYGASSIDRHGSYIFKNYDCSLPFISDADFIHKFNTYLIKNEIDVVFPTHDTVSMFLIQNQDRIKAKIIGSDARTAQICRDKLLTYKEFSDCAFCPKIYSSMGEGDSVFIKPRQGQGAVGAKLIEHQSDIPDNINDYVICEYLPGEEYTVDCFTDCAGVIRFISPRSRRRVMAGVSVSGTTERLTPEIQYIAEQINNRLKFNGLWWFQIKRSKTYQWKLLEISTRCPGTLGLTRAKGVNLPLLSVYNALKIPVEIHENDYIVQMDSSLIRRYRLNIHYSVVYIDFDDTIIVENKVYLKAIWFIYQCLNYDIKVILLTRHEGKISETMKNYHIDDSLFFKIVTVGKEELKSNYIDERQSIFIDNSWKERIDVSKKCGIPVFDVDSLDMLMDWRV